MSGSCASSSHNSSFVQVSVCKPSSHVPCGPQERTGFADQVGFSWETVRFLTNWMLTGNGEGSRKSSLLHTPDSGR